MFIYIYYTYQNACTIHELITLFFLQISITTTFILITVVGQAFEYGYLTDLDEIAASGYGSGVGEVEIAVASEEECFDIMNSNGQNYINVVLSIDKIIVSPHFIISMT